jgi:iron complex outermembrane recepter protein
MQTYSKDPAPTRPASGATGRTARRALLAILAATTSLTGAAAMAGEVAGAAAPAAAASTGVAEVVVTARRRSERLQDVPIAISAVGGERLARAGISQMQQLQFETPSLNVATPNPRQTNIAIRGLGNNPAADGLAASVGLYIDGVYLDRPGMANFDLLDVERIEVLRGPQGTLFGKNTTAGALSVTTQAPAFTPSFVGEVSLGNYNLRRYDLTVTGPVTDDLAVRLSAYANDRAGYLKNVDIGGAELGLHRWGLRGQALYRPSSNFSLRLIGEFAEESDSQGAFVLYSKGPSSSANPKFVPFDTWAGRLNIDPVFDPTGLVSDQNVHQDLTERQGALTADAEWTLPGGLTLSSISAFRHWTFTPHNDFDWGPAQVLAAQGVADDDDQVSQEFRIASPSGGAIDYIGGLYFFWRGLKADSITTYGPRYSVGLGALGDAALNNGTSEVKADPDTKSYAAFAQGTWHIDPRLSATLGLRGAYETSAETVTRLAFHGGTGTPPVSVAAYHGQLSVSNTTPSALASLSYRPNAAVMAYASASYGAKAGGFNSPAVPQSTTGVIQPISTLIVKPETALSYEAGVKSALFDRRLTLDADVFWTDLTNYQANTIVAGASGTFLSLITNVGKVRSRGVELEANAVPIDGLSLHGSVGYNDATYGAFAAAPAVQGSVKPTQDLSGRPVVAAPKWSVSVGGDYTHAIGGGYAGFVGADYAYKSGYYGYIDDSPYSWIKGYAVVNARLGLKAPGDHYELTLWVRNAFDSRAYSMVIPASTGSGGYYALPTEPRFYGATLKASF